MIMAYVFLSGGLDSTVLAAFIRPKIQNLRAIYVNHGQLGSSRELSVAKKVSRSLKMPFKVIDIPGLWPSFSDVAGRAPGPTTSAAIALSAGLVFALNYVAWAGE